MTEREALKLALEALELEDLACRYEKDPTPEHIAKAITAIREALAQPEQEPDGYVQKVIDALYENGDPVSVEAAELLEHMAQPQQEPVFWYRPCSNGMYEGPIHNAQIERVRKESGAWHPLYTSPPASKPWVGLTDQEIEDLWNHHEPRFDFYSFSCDIEAKLKEKNT